MEDRVPEPERNKSIGTEPAVKSERSYLQGQDTGGHGQNDEGDDGTSKDQCCQIHLQMFRDLAGSTMHHGPLQL